jgi:hypothetical protein
MATISSSSCLLGLLERSLELQVKKHVKGAISRLAGKLYLNAKFIVSLPKRPALRSKKTAKESVLICG